MGVTNTYQKMNFYNYIDMYDIEMKGA